MGNGDRVGAPGERHERAPPRDVAPVLDEAPSCWRCTKKLAESLTRSWSMTCPRYLLPAPAPSRGGWPAVFRSS